MKIFDKVEGDLVVREDTDLHGMVTGSVSVTADQVLVINGMVVGDVIAETGSKVVVNGMVRGTVENRGAMVEVYGVVGRIFDHDPAAPSRIDANARVVGR